MSDSDKCFKFVAILVVAACCGLRRWLAVRTLRRPSPRDEPGSGYPVEGRVTRNANGLHAISPVYTIDRIYKSMTGPWSNRDVRFLESRPTPELTWITGCQVAMVGAGRHDLHA